MISDEMFDSFAQTVPPAVDSCFTDTPPRSRAFDMLAYLSKHGFEVESSEPCGMGGLIYKLKHCPFNVDHTGGSAAFFLRNGKPGFKCYHQSCNGKKIGDIFKLHAPDYAPNDTGQPEQTPRFARVEDIPWIWDVAAVECRWVLQDLIPEGIVTLITGKFGGGKSTFVSALAYAVSRGDVFMGLQTTKRPALILDGENSAAAVVNRFRRLRITEKNDTFRIWGRWVGEDPPSCDCARVVDYVERNNPRPLIAVDNFIAFHEGSENDADRVRAHMKFYQRLTALGATVILLHHRSKAGQSYRGSNDIPGAVDNFLEIESKHEGGLLSRVTLKAEKQRVTVAVPMNLSYEDGRFTIEEKRQAPARRERFVELLSGNPGISRAALETLGTDAGLPRQAVRSFVQCGLKMKEVEEREDQGEDASRGRRSKAKGLYWIGANVDKAVLF